MTREEAKKKISIENKEVYPYGIIDNVDSVIDEIFDSFENRTCDNCKYCSDIISNSYKCDLFECYQQKALKHCGNWQLKK